MVKHPDRMQILTAAHWGTYVANDRADGVELTALPEDPAPSRIGKGWVSAMSDPSVRIGRPAFRKGWLDGDGGAGRNDDSYVEVDWDTALDHVASELGRVINIHGNEAIFGGSYGWASAGRFHHAQSQLRRFLNQIGGYTGARNTYSHAAAEVLFPRILGMSVKQVEETMTSWPEISDNYSMMLAFGGISGRTAQIASGGTSEHETDMWMERAAKDGVAVVSVSPLKSDLADLPGSEWLPVRAGADTALILALCHEVFQNNWQDDTFLARTTSGLDVFKDYVMGRADRQAKSPEWAAPICDLPASGIRALAARIAKEKVMVSVAWGLQRADHGEQVVWAALALSALLGRVGQKGLGFGFGYGSTTPPGRPKRFLPWPSLPRGQNPVDRFIPVARLTDMLMSPGESFPYDGATLRFPDIRLIYWAGGNPFHHHQDLFRLEEAWTKPETVIVQDHSWTATARRADIVLPSSSALERDDLMINKRDPRLIYMSQILPRFEEARDDFEIFSGLARRMGVETAFTEGRNQEEWMRSIWADCERVAMENGVSLPQFDDFQRKGRFDIPEAEKTRIFLDAFIKDPQGRPLNTESGRITLFNAEIAAFELPDCPGHPAWIEPAEWTFGADRDVFHLISNQPATRLHSQLDNGSESRASKQDGREVCTIHKDAAAQLGLVEGDIVQLRNARGATLAALHLSKGLRTDCVVLPTGAWLDLQETECSRIDVHGNPNVLTIDKGTSGLAQGNISHTTVVRLSKWTGPLPELRVTKQPVFVQATKDQATKGRQ